ncbi:T9SS type A sorting domain-containing protein [Polaribacter sp. M15]
MKKILLKLLFVVFLVSGSAIYSQTALPGTIEVESGDLSQNNAHFERNIVGDGNSGTSNIVLGWRKTRIEATDGDGESGAGKDGTIINHVSIAADGNYDFTFTYYKSSNDNTISINSTNSTGGSSTTLASFTLPKNSSTGATPSSYGTHTVTGVALTTGITYITFKNAAPAVLDLDNVIVAASAAATPPTMTSTGTGDWDDPATWTVSGEAATVPSTTPTAEYDVVIGAHVITIPSNTGAVAAKSITCTPSAGGQLILRQNNNLTVTENFSLDKSNNGMIIYAQNGTMSTMTFGGSYLATKKTTIIKRLSSLKWHLIGNPFNNNRVDHTTEHSSSQLRDNGSVLSLGSYDTATDAYSYYTNVTPLTSGPRFGTAQGYAISTEHATTPDYALQGDQHSGSVSYTLSTAGNGFNLLGNPYLSYIHANDAADGTNNILRVNGANGSNILSEDTIWLWDADNDTWITKVLGDASYRINPLQGFFVKASSASAFSFTKNMETHTATDAFLKSKDSRFEIDLSIANGKKSVSTSIRYIDGASKSFDNGYDGSIFGGYASEFQVYTEMLESINGKKLAIQSLPNSDYDNMIIPVGINAAANSEITFSAKTLNVPTGYKVYLEDRLNNTFTRLDEVDAKYTATITKTSTEGRFYIHTSAKSVLSSDTELLNSVNIFKSNATTLRIIGLSQGKASVKLYNVLGKQVMTSNFNATGVKELALPNLSKGVYIVQLETETGKLNKKIVLE